MASLINDRVYLDTPEQWDELVARCRKAGLIGLDTEFYNVDVRKQSCVGRAKIHVWSVAIRTTKMSPRGYHRARGWVLPAAALEYPPIRAMLEDPAVKMGIHNQPVDDHAMANHGIKLRGAINTLDLSRWTWPELIPQKGGAGGFDVKSLMRSKLGYEPVCEFLDVVRYRDIDRIEKVKKTKVNVCSCGEPGCRKRKGHEKTATVVEELVVVEKEVTKEYPLESIVPGHERFDLLCDYAAVDAIAAVELLELAKFEPDPAEWPYALLDSPEADDRPKFNQAVIDEIVLMERRGFPIDCQYASDKYNQACEDEAKELLWLRTWFRKNVPVADEDGWELETGIGVEDEDIDLIWSSNPQMTALFDYFGFPRSPVWKKGKVKRGDVKLDGAALEWISKNHKPAKQLIARIVQLKKIRGQKKYLLKMRDSGGHVNPICGPAGDHDDRNGAVTGRLGVKGVLEAQQLTNREEVDLYQVRKAIVAPPGKVILVADYSALEVVILADLCKRLFGDTQLEAMVAPGAPDIHVENAKTVFGHYLGWTVPATCLSGGEKVECKYAGQRVDEIPSAEFKKHPYGAILRGMIKTVWYGLQYGKGAYGFSVLEGPDGNPIGEKVAQEMLDGIKRTVPAIFMWQDWCRERVDADHGIYSLDGRWCPLYDESASEGVPDWLRARGYRRAYNFPMQATCAGIIGEAMARIANDPEFKRLGFEIVLQVHDELVAIGPAENVERAAEILKGHMVAATANGTPLLIQLQVSAGWGPNYYEAK